MWQKISFTENCIVKKIICSLLVCHLIVAANAQTDTTLLYLRFPYIPSFKLYNIADSSVFTKDNLKKKKATLIMMFSPDCEHCQEETKAITANIDLFKKVQIVMASPLNFDYIRKFYDEYKIANYPNITMGRDPTYFLGTFFKVRSFPALFLYDKKGRLVNHFTGETSVQEIANLLK
jgi:thioredoxin-related protein